MLHCGIWRTLGGCCFLPGRLLVTGMTSVMALLHVSVCLCTRVSLLGPFIASASHLDPNVEYRALPS